VSRAGFRWRGSDGILALVAVLVLAVGVYYVLAFYLVVPYAGVDYDHNWVILGFDEACNTNPAWCQANSASLSVGDQLLAAGDLTLERYEHDRTAMPFAGYGPGQQVPVTVLRDGAIQRMSWQMLGPTLRTRAIRLSSLLFFLPFWLAGSAVLLFLRPRDGRWLLLVSFNYLIALWIASGIDELYRVSSAMLVCAMLSTLAAPIFIHLHMLVPTPLEMRRWRWVLYGLYAVAVLGCVWQIWQPVPETAYLGAMVVGIVWSLAILIVRSFGSGPTFVRHTARLMLMGVSLAFGPGILVWLIPQLAGSATDPGMIPVAIMTLSLPLLPFFYIYALYKRPLGDLEFRANRLLSLYSFILLFGLAFVVVFLAGNNIFLAIALANGSLQGGAPQPVFESTPAMAFALGVSVVFLLLALRAWMPYRRFVDRLAYGTEHNPETIIRTFANEIPRVLERPALARLLTHDVSPALLIRQSALYLLGAEAPALVYADGVAPCREPQPVPHLTEVLRRSGHYVAPDSEQCFPEPFAWVRLAIPIEVEGKRMAAWLFGKRDPDDYYPQPDVELLTTLGNQVGVALETTRLFEDLHRRATELETAYRDLQRLDKLKDEFVQNVSHELRTPLTFLRGYIDLMIEEVLGPVAQPQREALQTMSDRTEGVIRLVNDIISLQQASAEQMVQEPVNLGVLARSCMEAAEVAARKHNAEPPLHRFRLELAEDVPHVIGDRRRLAQVVDNLLSNAVKFSPDGGLIIVRVAYRAGPASGPGLGDVARQCALLEVIDQGIGIPAAEIDHIWQRFYQVDGSSTRRFGGMGLGLSIVRGIVEAHGGAVQVRSKEGHGSTFQVILPLAPAAVKVE
jgi:signal transduction histidine kinase